MLTIDEAYGIARIEFDGLLTIGSITDAMLELQRHSGSTDMGLIWDFTHGDLSSFRSRELSALAHSLANRREYLPTHIAMITARGLEYGVLRMWQVYAEPIAGVHWHLVADEISAREWLLQRHRHHSPKPRQLVNR